MIHTDHFVFVHVPKTGGTFVTTSLYRIHLGFVERFVYRLRLALTGSHLRPSRDRWYYGPYGGFFDSSNKHATCAEIPSAHLDKPVLAAVRNPYSRYVSEYEFGWWRRPKYLQYYRKVKDFDRRFGHFPDLSFEDFVHLKNESYCRSRKCEDGTHTFGWVTEDFVKFFFRNSMAVRKAMTDEYWQSGEFHDDMYDVTLLDTDRLGRELYEQLLKLGYREPHVRFLLDSQAIVPGGRTKKTATGWRQFYTAETASLVRHKERVLFELFPSFDIAL